MRKKAKTEKNIFLTGFMCSGKTSVGQALASLLGMDFSDTDELFSRMYGSHPAEFITKRGLAEFRRKEEKAVRFAARHANSVIALGGGVTMAAVKWRSIRKSSTVIFIDCPAAELEKRLAKKTELIRRPLVLHSKNIRKRISALLQKRMPGYMTADITVSNSGHSIKKTAATIKKLLRQRKSTRKS